MTFLRSSSLESSLRPVDELEGEDHNGEDDDHRGRVVGNEVEEGEPRLRADHDVGWVADQRGRAADVARHDLGDEVGHRIDFEQLAYHERHRADEQHRGDVVEEGGQDGRDQDEGHHDPPGVAVGLLGRRDGRVLEETRFLDHRHEQHHAEQDADRVEVDVADAGVEGDDAGDDENEGARQSRDASVDLFGGHEHHDADEHED
jgi:hypothetical protein